MVSVAFKKVALEIIRRPVTAGRTERTGETHALYCYWDQNGRSYKTTMCCNRENYYDKLRALVDKAHAAAISKGADDTEVVVDASIFTSI